MSGLWPWEQAWFWEMTVSDWLMVTFGFLVLVFVIDYAFGNPWWTHPIGFIVLFYGISVLLLVFLIVYGMVAGQRVEEWARLPVTAALVISILGKLIILHYERRNGQIEALHARRNGGMTL